MTTIPFTPRRADAGRPRQAVAGTASMPYIARQPILTDRSAVYAYELLFRSPRGEALSEGPPHFGGALALTDAVLTIGLDTLTRGRRAFVKIPRGALVEGIPTLLPPEHVVIELGHDVAGDGDALSACETLADAGYQLALHNYMPLEGMDEFLKVADYARIDFESMREPEARAELLRTLATAKTQLIAANIGTQDEFERAQWEGFRYFQGYFFGRAILHQAREIPPRQLACLQLLKALNDPYLKVDDLEDIIKRDAMLTYRLLRAVSSAGTSMPADAPAARSIQLAILMLGRDTVRRWASLWTIGALADHGRGGMAEMVTMSTVRARCCELLDLSADGDGFLLGMCSLLDAILGHPLEKIVALLPLSDETREALCGGANGQRLLLDAVIAYERGDWEACEAAAQAAGLDADRLPAVYRDALEWTRGLEGGSAA